jgi:hypothetical protein
VIPQTGERAGLNFKIKRLVFLAPIFAACAAMLLCGSVVLAVFPQLGQYSDMVVVRQFAAPIASSRCQLMLTQRSVMATHTDWQTVAGRLPGAWTHHPEGRPNPGIFSASKVQELRFFGVVHSFVEYKQDVVPAKVFLSHTLTLVRPGCRS